MSPFLWWLGPIVATFLASCWAAWVRHRSRRRPSDGETVASYARFRAVLRDAPPVTPDGPNSGQPF